MPQLSENQERGHCPSGPPATTPKRVINAEPDIDETQGKAPPLSMSWLVD